MSKVVKKQMHLLQNSDVIYFVYRKNEPEQSMFFSPHLLSIICFDSTVASKNMTQISHIPHLSSIFCFADIAYMYQTIRPLESASQDVEGKQILITFHSDVPVCYTDVCFAIACQQKRLLFHRKRALKQAHTRGL